jgi:hypothetical protein
MTLDPQAEFLIAQTMRQTGESRKEVLNRAVTEALGSKRREPFDFPTFDMGEPLVELDHTGRLLTDLDAASFGQGAA